MLSPWKLLSLFSPINIKLGEDEGTWLKQFQRKICTMVYTHVLGQGSQRALELVSKFGRIVEDLHKCGQIFHKGVVHYAEEGKLEDIETIEIVQL